MISEIPRPRKEVIPTHETGGIKVQYLPETSLSVQRVRRPQDFDTGLLAARYSEIVIHAADSPATVILAVVNYPEYGKHLALLLDQVAPATSGFRLKHYLYGGVQQGIQDDFYSAVLAREVPLLPFKRKDRKEAERLDKLHVEDPHISPAYKTFILNHNRLFHDAIKTDASSALDVLYNDVDFIDTNVFGRNLFRHMRQEIASGNLERMLSMRRHAMLSHPNKSWSTYSQMKAEEFIKLPEGKQMIRMKQFLRSLSQDERNTVSIQDEADRNSATYIDPKTGQSWHPPYSQVNLKPVRSENGELVPLRSEVNTVYLRTEDPIDGKYAWNVDHIDFSSEQPPQSLYPLIAIADDGKGNKRFLPQHEVLQYYPYLPIPDYGSLDVKLGEIYIDFCSGVYKQMRIPRHMGLKDSPVAQRLMGGQVPVLEEMPDRQAALLSDLNPVIQALKLRV